jgi:outer membrane receptor for ferrienterochelin and colicin
MGRIFYFSALLLLCSVPIPGLNFLIKSTFALDKLPLIKGKVIDAETKSTIEFATISLFQYPDSLPIQMTATNAKGEFNFANLKAGSYTISVYFMGFKKFNSQPFNLAEKVSEMLLENIPLEIEPQAIKEISVVTKAGNPNYQPDRKTIYVENQLSGAGGTASDLLFKLPSVTQSPDGKIAIHGNTNLLVYINGKPSSMKGSQLLESTSAAEIKKIELITSPSAKYDASGSGGIINLITKKSTNDGFNGNGQAATDHLGGYASDLLLNYKYKNLSFFSGIDHNRRRNEGELDYVTNYLTEKTRFAQSGIQKSQRTNTGFRGGVDYQPTLEDKISISGNAGIFETTNNGDWHTVKSVVLKNMTDKNNSTNENIRQGNYGGADFTYEHKFETPNKSFSVSALWNTLNYDDHYLNLISEITGNELMRQTTQLSKKFNTSQINGDYISPSGKSGNLEFGFQLSTNEEIESYESNLSNPQPAIITKQETHFNEIIGAVYGTWQYKIEKLELKAGIRAEYQERSLQTFDNNYPLHSFDLYPSLNSSFKISSIQEILVNYSRRTDHLKTIQLDPLPRWYDFYNVMMGNPDLTNEITDKIAIDYLINFPRLSLVSELYFYNTSDKIEIIRSIYNDGIIRNRYENTGSERTLGLEINANWRTASWLKLNAKVDFIDSRLDIRLEPIARKKNYQQFYSVTSASLSFSPTLFLELDFSYFGPALTAQSSVDRCYMAGIGIRKTFFGNKLTATITGRDFLGLYTKVDNIQGADFDQVLSVKNKFPIRFTLGYKFNHYKRDERRVAKSPVAE